MRYERDEAMGSRLRESVSARKNCCFIRPREGRNDVILAQDGGNSAAATWPCLSHPFFTFLSQIRAKE